MIQDRSRAIYFLKLTLVFFVIGFLAIYFRTYSLHGGGLLSFRSPGSMAREIVDRGIKTQIRASLEKDFPQMATFERERLADLQVQRLKSQDRSNYEDAVRKAVLNMDKVRTGGGYHYLLEADPYHFLLQTERLLTTGKIADVRQGGKYLEPFMRAPHGSWEVFLLHPYVGLYWYKIIRFFSPQASLMKTLGFLPLFLTLLILPLYAWLGRVFQISLGATVIGMATIALSPIYMQRSALGWYDTDPYNYIFPIMILAFVFQGLKDRKWYWAGILGASSMTGLYGLFWPGYAFIGILIPASLLGSTAVLWTLQRFKGGELVNAALRFGGLYILGSLIFLAIFLSPKGLMESLSLGWFALNQYALAGKDIWPNIFLTVGEAESITLKKLIFLTGNYVTFAMAVAGLFWEGLHVLRRQDAGERLRFFFFLFFGAPILLMSLKTERFSVLFVLPLAIFAGFFVGRFIEWVQGFLPKFLPGVARREGWVRAVAFLLVGMLYAPMLLLSAHVVAMGIRPIMDDVWYAGLLELRAKTPEDAIVDSWWPPGYFISGVAHRRVVVDGGTQHFHTSYWMAKVLMADDERKAAGILRMLNTSGEDAPEFLEGLGMEVPDAVDLILKVVQLSRHEALRELPSFLSAEQKEAFLDKTHGRGALSPSYVFIYNDLVEQNLAVSVVANWDFRKAKSIQEKKNRSEEGFLDLLGRDSGKRYIQDLLQTSGKWLKYTPISPLAKREGSVYFFTNGLRVDLAAKDATIVIPSQGIQGVPASFFFLEQEKLVEKVSQANTLDASALFFEDQGAFYSVIADARLIRSLLFKLYYLNGAGLSLFKPILSQGTLREGTCVRAFELEREKLGA